MIKMNEMSELETAKLIDKQRDNFKVRKYVVNRVLEGETQARAAYKDGVSAYYVWQDLSVAPLVQRGVDHVSHDVLNIETMLPLYLKWYNTVRPHFTLDIRSPLDLDLAGAMGVDDITVTTSVHDVIG